MSYPPPSPASPDPFLPPSQNLDKDAEHLKILSVCWYVLAGLQCLGLCGGVAYIAMGLFGMMGGHGDDKTAGGIFACAGVFVLILSVTLAFLSYKVGKSLIARTNRTLCFVLGALVCLSIPIGTVLGVFTLMVLSRPSVKESFH